MSEEKSVNVIARERVEDLANRGAEPTWLKENRLASWEAYLQTPMPGPRDEEWRRTDISALDLSTLITLDFGPSSNSLPGNTDTASPAMPHWLQLAVDAFPNYSGLVSQVTQANGYSVLNKELSDKGVVFTDIKSAVEQFPQLIQPYLSKLANQTADGKFTLMNKAFFNCGAFLYVPANIEITAPFLSGISLEAETGAIFPRLIVVAEANSKVNLVHAISNDSAPTTNKQTLLASSLVEIYVQEGAKVSYLELQSPNKNVFSFSRIHNEIGRDGEFNSLSVALGGNTTKSDIATLLQAPGAHSEVLGIVLGSDNEHYSYNTIQEHNAPDTTSDINFRVALKDGSSSVYQGIIKVAKVAQRTSAFQSNKNLLLGTQARADSIPKLEILADDVKCSHGATVGPVDHEQIFYLMSRGLSPQQAEELIVVGFFQQVLEKFGFEAATNWLVEIISQKIYQHA